MSLILKGIDMPKEKDEALLLLILGDGTVAEKIDSDRYEEMTNTQAIQIPKGHGDIKDINTVEDELDERCGQLSAEIVRNAPTILEAEESK